MHYSDLDSINGRIFNRTEVSLGEAELREVEACYRFLEDFEQGKVIYGINTGFGPMAQYRIGDADLNSLQYNIIRSHSCGAGETLPDICVRAAMLARLQTFLNAKSGVHPDVVRILADFLNNEIYPLVPRHGSVGASGDLVQLAHIALALIGESEVSFRGETVSAAEAMKACGITPLRLRIRDGLALTNGTAVMTGIGMVNLAQARRLRKRETELYNGDTGEAPTFKHKVQPYYSLRCTPQILGPVLETLEQAEKILVEEFNSVDDNPVVDSKTGTIYHGGNFHGDYVSLEMDKLKIAVTKMTMLAERQLNYLFHDRINETLPPFVNLGKLGLNYGLQAAQFTATSTTAESQTLSNPMYVHSIPNNNDNQDIVSMGTNAAMLTRQVIENGYQVLAIEMLALVQAADYLECAAELSAQTRQLYDDIRRIVPKFIDDTPKYREIAAIENFLKQQA